MDEGWPRWPKSRERAAASSRRRRSSLGTTNLRILGREIALPADPAPNTEVALADIPGLVSGTVILNEQATFGDGATSKIIAVAPLRLLLRLSLAGLGGLADVEVSLAGNSASVDCAPDGEAPAPEPPTETPTNPPTDDSNDAVDPTTPTTPTTPSTPTTPETDDAYHDAVDSNYANDANNPRRRHLRTRRRSRHRPDAAVGVAKLPSPQTPLPDGRGA